MADEIVITLHFTRADSGDILETIAIGGIDSAEDHELAKYVGAALGDLSDPAADLRCPCAACTTRRTYFRAIRRQMSDAIAAGRSTIRILSATDEGAVARERVN